ncbi:hypothetical protein TNCV_764491, partial [Trichonephila clavipes]
MAHSIGSETASFETLVNLHEILNYSAKFSSATGNRNVAANISKELKLFDDKFALLKPKLKKEVTYKPFVFKSEQLV